MKWIRNIETGLVEKIPQVRIAKIAHTRKAEGGYFFDLHLKLTDGKRGICQGIFICSEFIKEGSYSKISDIFTDIVKDEIKEIA